MSLLIESIRIYNGRVYNIHWHNKRCNLSRKALFGSTDTINLRNHISVPRSCTRGLYKCKITYDGQVQSVEFSPYQIRSINKVALIKVEETNYKHKYSNRETLEHYRTAYKDYDEIIMVRAGLITDAYYYNVVVEKNGKLLTPKKPILHGIQRQKLIEKDLIKALDITVDSLLTADCIHLINALTPLGKIVLKSQQVEDFL